MQHETLTEAEVLFVPSGDDAAEWMAHRERLEAEREATGLNTSAEPDVQKLFDHVLKGISCCEYIDSVSKLQEELVTADIGAYRKGPGYVGSASTLQYSFPFLH